MAGLFITFEGGEGSGKTTQINRLADALTKAGRKVITTREPGGTPEAEKIRDFLVQRDGGNWSPMAEALLLFAARVMHYNDIIAPALENNKIVISDRFTDSTRAYQGYGHGMELDKLEQLKELTMGEVEPDLTFILDIESEEGLARSERRLNAESLHIAQTEDRFEKLEIEFHERLRQGFLAIAKDSPDRCKIIDATKSPEDMAEEIFKLAEQALGDS